MSEKIIDKQSLLYTFCEIGYEWPSFGKMVLPGNITSCAFWIYVGVGVVIGGLISVVALSVYVATQLLLIGFGVGYLWKNNMDTPPLYFRPFIPLWGSGESSFRISKRNLPLWPVATTIMFVLMLNFPIAWYGVGMALLVVVATVVSVIAAVFGSCLYHYCKDKFCGRIRFE